MGKVILVKASAGSGKTFKLASAFVRKLLGDCQRGNRSSFQNIIAITFTRAATKEMVVRVLDYLIGLSTGTAEKHVVEEIAPDIPEDLRRKVATCILEEIFKNFSLLRISTIDSLVTSIFRASLFVKNLPPHLEVLPGAEDIYRRAMEMGLDKSVMHEGKGDRIKKVTLSSYSLFNTHTFDIYSRIENFLREYFNAMIFRNIEIGKFKANYPLSAEHEARELLSTIESLKCDKGATHKLAEKSGYSFILEFLTKMGVEELIDGRKKCKEKEELNKKFQSIKRKLSDYYWEIVKGFSFDIGDLLSEGKLIFHQLIKEEGTIPLDYSMKLLVELIKSYRFPESYIFLAERVNYLLVDEFQDTSDSQWEFLESVAENVVAEGGIFFAVGDPKQTIYFWRGSKEDIFSEVNEKFKHFSSTEDVVLKKNYRSGKTVIEFVNKFFNPDVWKKYVISSIMGSSDKDKQKISFYRELQNKIESYLDRYYNVTHFSEKEGGYVEIRLIEEGNKDSNLESIASSLKEIIEEQVTQKGYRYKDIAILLRKRNEIRKISSYLMANNVPVKTSHGLNILDELLIREIVSLLKFLNNPSDNLSFLQFVEGEIFRSAAGDKIPPLEDFLESLLDSRTLYYITFKEKHGDLWSEFFADIFRRVGFTPVADLIWLIYEKFRILVNFPKKRPLFIHFVEVVRNIEERNSDINSFLESLESGEIEEEDLVIPSQESADAVTISTYHKAKGLEWPIVIIPYMAVVFNWRMFNSFHPTLIVDSEGSIFALTSSTASFIDRERLHLGVKEYVLQVLGEINNFYVATTRAKDKLFMFVPIKYGNSKNTVSEILQSIFPFEDGKFIAGENTPRKVEERKKKPLTESEIITPASIIPPLSVYNWRNNLVRKSEEFRELDDNEIRRMKKGTFYHAVLERIKYLDYKEEQMEGQVKGIIDMLLKDQEFKQFRGIKDLLIQKLLEFLSDQKIKRFFSRKEYPESEWEINNEFEIVNGSGESFRIDRFMKGKSGAVIIDYKTTFDNLDSYEEQVRNYGRLVSEIFNISKERITLLLLSIEEREIHHVTFN